MKTKEVRESIKREVTRWTPQIMIIISSLPKYTKPKPPYPNFQAFWIQAIQLMGGGSGGGGGGDHSSMLTKEENVVLSSSEDSSSTDDGELELGLGLSLGGGEFASRGHQAARILTAIYLDFGVSGSSSSSSLSSSSSSSSLSRVSVTAGTKRSADSVASANGASQVVGWPPIRAYRVNSMANQAKSVAIGDFSSMVEQSKSKDMMVETPGNDNNRSKNCSYGKTSLFVKVNMDGFPIGRKVDLSAHACYETLARVLEAMFIDITAIINRTRSSIKQNDSKDVASRALKLLDGTSEFVLTYEDKEGDWMLVGDVPWGMFIGSVRRLRIMRTSDATGLGIPLTNGCYDSSF